MNQSETVLIYNSNVWQDREVLAYARSVSESVMKEYDVQSHKFTETQIKKIADTLGVKVNDLIDQESVTYIEKYIQTRLSPEDALTALKKNCDLMITPIAICGEHGSMIKSAKDLINKGMIEAPSAES